MEEIEEVWKECGEGSQKKYEISNLGRVKSITKINKIEKILKGGFDGRYQHIIINGKTEMIHRLVAYNFLGSRPEGLIIDHFDRNKLNNKVSNLRYVTLSENQKNSDKYRADILTNNPQERKNIIRKEKVTCDCGSIVAKGGLLVHTRSELHQNWLKNNS